MSTERYYEIASNALQLIDNLKKAVDNYIIEHTER